MAARWGYLHAVGATLVAGGATYVFLGIVSRSLDDGAFDAFSVYWSLSLIVGFGLFLPVEQELARLSASTIDQRAAARAALLVAAEVTVAALVLVGIASPLLVTAGVSVEAVGVAALLIPASALQFLARGRMLLTGRITAYANVLIADSTLRVLIAGGLALAASVLVPTAGGFLLGLVSAILLAHLPVLRGVRVGSGGDPGARAAIRTAVLGLVAGTLAAQLILNAGPVLIGASDAAPGLAGAFQASFSLARIPLFILVPLQGLLVGPLAAQVARGESRRMVGSMLRLAAIVLAGSLAGAGLGYLLGPWIVELVFGPGRALPAEDIALLVGGVGAHCGLVIVTQALVAAGLHSRAGATWIVAAIVFAGVFAVVSSGGDPVAATTLAFVTASAVGWAVSLTLLATGRGRRGEAAEPVVPSD